MKANAPIGIYDSGMGGLTVRQAVCRLLPEESVIYLGDGKNCPYGSRTVEEIRQLSIEAVEYLRSLGCKLVVVACNTATAAAIDHLRATYPAMPIVGMEPAVKPACLYTKSRVVGVLATERSLDGELFRRTAAKYGADIEVLTTERESGIVLNHHCGECGGSVVALGIDLGGEYLQKGLHAIEDTAIASSTHLNTTGIDAKLILLALEFVVEQESHITPLRRNLSQRQVGEQIVGGIGQLLVADKCCLCAKQIVSIALHNGAWLRYDICRIRCISYKE